VNVSVETIDPTSDPGYAELVWAARGASFFQTPLYLQLVSATLDLPARAFAVRSPDGALLAAIPWMVSRPNALGGVMNALPFYGSHGGPIARAGEDHRADALLAALRDQARSSGCTALTVIETPKSEMRAPLERAFAAGGGPRDFRIRQATPLPMWSGAEETFEAALFALLDKKQRNAIRKGRKSVTRTERSFNDADFDFLYETHHANIARLGGIPKPQKFFVETRARAKLGHDYDLWCAYAGEQPVAAMLVFYSHGTAEYFTPAVLQEYRDQQVLSALIYDAIAHSARIGMQLWNWGGTWPTQTGVYQFKEGWGAVPLRYEYFTEILDSRVLEVPPERLLADHPYFYVRPFTPVDRP
jgi:hypothetical protein